MPEAATSPAFDPNDIAATIAALDGSLEVPGAAPVATTIEEFQAQAPVAPPAPEPAVETPAVPAASEPPAPFDPTKERDPNLAKNWRISDDLRVTAQNAVEQTAFQLRREAREAGQSMSLADAERAAYEKLGLMVPTPAAPAAAPVAEPAPQAPASPLEALNAEIAALQEELADLNPALDFHRYNEVITMKDAKMDERAELRISFRVQQALQEREAVAEAATAGEQQFAEVAARFTDLNDTSTPFHARFVELHNANVLADAPALADVNYERNLAAQIAGEFLLSNKPFNVKSAATTPAASPPTGTPPAAVPPAAIRTAPAPAGMAPLPGNHAAPTSEHRVTVHTADPAQAQQQQLSQVIAGGDMVDILASLDADLGGPPPQGMRILSIE